MCTHARPVHAYCAWRQLTRARLTLFSDPDRTDYRAIAKNAPTAGSPIGASKIERLAQQKGMGLLRPSSSATADETPTTHAQMKARRINMECSTAKEMAAAA
jgi:hypothetical protein